VIELAAIEAARERIADVAVRTPLIRLHVDDAPAEIYLKLETLQPINSFKIRGATNAVRMAPERAPATWPKGSRGSRASSACRRRSPCPSTRRRRSSRRSRGSAAP
jgi:threonine dehydratase